MSGGHRGTYSPDDNRLRLYPAHRLDQAEYERVKALGFSWAAKQELFVAGAWTPAREDALLELCGQIGDEDTSLVDRAELRAERFEGYRERRASEAENTYKAVTNLADGIPFGQPILIGHHSERRARRDAQRIQDGMRRAGQFWETSSYWKDRAASALQHARYKQLPGVRHRRIKGLESDHRRFTKTRTNALAWIERWKRDGLTLEIAQAFANRDDIRVEADGQPYGASLWSELRQGRVTPERAREIAVNTHGRVIRHTDRWIAHLNHRLEYERAMLGESGGIAASRFEIEIGGRVLCGDEWLTVLKLNKGANGALSSVTVPSPRHYPGTLYRLPIERVRDYRAPEPGDAEAVKAATKRPPMVNYPGEGFVHLTRSEYDRRYHHTSSVDETEEFGAHRLRKVSAGGMRMVGAFITDAKRVDPPAATQAATPAASETTASAGQTPATETPAL